MIDVTVVTPPSEDEIPEIRAPNLLTQEVGSGGIDILCIKLNDLKSKSTSGKETEKSEESWPTKCIRSSGKQLDQFWIDKGNW